MGIKKLSKNKYHARYFAGYNSHGKRVYPSKTFKTRRDANTWLTAKLREKHLGAYAEASTLTLSQYIEQWFAAKKHSLRENTLYTYDGYIRQYVGDLGRMKLAAVRPNHIEQWQTQLLTRISARTVAGVRVMLGGVFRRAVKNRLITHNPVRDAEAPKWKRATKQCLTPEQANAFLDQCSGPIGQCLAFMLHTGVRPEEVMAVRWRDLDLDGERGACHVREVILRIAGGGWRFELPKTKNSIRTIGFPSTLATELKEHRRRQLEDRMKIGRHYQDYDLVFPMKIGTPLSRQPIVSEFKRTLARAGLPTTMRLYDLRHSFVTLSLAAEVDIKTVSEEAGHATTAFTLDHYGHVLKVMRDKAVDKRAALLAAHKTASK